MQLKLYLPSALKYSLSESRSPRLVMQHQEVSESIYIKVILYMQSRVCVYVCLIVNNLYIIYVERELGLELGLGLGFLHIYVNI